MNTECRYCHALGHSKNNCPKLKLKKPVDTLEPKSMLLARKQNEKIKVVVEQKSMFEIDFPSLGGDKFQVKPSKIPMNFLATVNKKKDEICAVETTEEKTIIHNGVVLNVL